MSSSRKIATCCYCGTRAALVLKGQSRHELACSNCGAPLHDLKMLPRDHHGDRELVDGHKVSHLPNRKPAKSYRKAPKRKKRFSKLFEEAFDLIEDIFD